VLDGESLLATPTVSGSLRHKPSFAFQYSQPAAARNVTGMLQCATQRLKLCQPLFVAICDILRVVAGHSLGLQGLSFAMDAGRFVEYSFCGVTDEQFGERTGNRPDKRGLG
jgi:hypothetical protein